MSSCHVMHHFLTTFGRCHTYDSLTLQCRYMIPHTNALQCRCPHNAPLVRSGKVACLRDFLIIVLVGRAVTICPHPHPSHITCTEKLPPPATSDETSAGWSRILNVTPCSNNFVTTGGVGCSIPCRIVRDIYAARRRGCRPGSRPQPG